MALMVESAVVVFMGPITSGQRVPRCALGDFCGRNCMSFELLRGHVEDFLFRTGIFPVLKWESLQGVSAGYFSR